MSRQCAEPTCLNPIPAKGRKTRFCCRTCNLKARNRDLKRGALLMQVMRRWRRDGRRDHKAGTPVPPIPVRALPLLAQPEDPLATLVSGFTALTRLWNSFEREDREARDRTLAARKEAARWLIP
jgi:hypothetical protein